MYIINLFNEHPKNVNLTYYEHFKLSSSISFKLFISSIKAFVHSIFPFVFVTSTTNVIDDIENQLKKRI